jgi:leucyl-tRNA synthetase
MKLSNALIRSKMHQLTSLWRRHRNLNYITSAICPPYCRRTLANTQGHQDSVHTQPWPKVDPEALVLDEITLVIQIMGKTRGTIQVPANLDKAGLEKAAR